MSRPVKEGEVAEAKDLTELKRMLKRAKINSTRELERRDEVIQLLSKLVSIFTEEQFKGITRRSA